MIKVLIVDDEAMARINLRYMLNWEKEGYVICGEADSGTEALKKIEELKPDIVFTDMNMPGMNGIEFIKNARKISTSIKIIAFSGFEDFEYVRQSLKEGVIDYLVKYKMDAESVLSILNTIKENLKKESLENQRINQMMNMAMSGKTYMRKNVLINILKGYLQEEFKVVCDKYDINLEERNIIVSVARIDNYYQLKKKFNVQEFNVFIDTIENIFLNICAEIGNSVHVSLDEGKFAFIMSFSNVVSEAKLSSDIISNIRNIENGVKRFLNITMSFGVSSLCPSIKEIANYYQEACILLEKGYYKGVDYIIQKNEVANNDSLPSFAGLTVADEKKIIAYIRALNKDGVVETLEDVFKNLKIKKCSFENVKLVSIDLINILQRIAKELNLNGDVIYPSSNNLYEEIIKFGNLEEILDWFKLLYNSLMELLKRNLIQDNYSTVIKKTIEFVLKNYGKNISLSDAAENVKVSPQYLSKVFKEECGTGFVAYLNSVRIEQAKMMISEGCELKTLTQKLGFNSYTYFFTVFKEVSGMTPQQYEKLIKKSYK
jgi:Response regulator containing CheY-like receiver domain and AraC-type DNA-binding domain